MIALSAMEVKFIWLIIEMVGPLSGVDKVSIGQ
jgi:hypothetical protein